MANHDKIYLSYIGEFGEKSRQHSKNRIDWILKNIGTGKKVLDVGCSQGIISILAAKNENIVKGIDIEEEAVDFANKLLDEKYPEEKEKVTFEFVDFMNYSTEEKFDVIILTEVLEHLENPEDFIKKTKEFLNNDGKVILSVPFGVNDHPDHRRTYYYLNFADVVCESLYIEKVEFMERWIGAVASINKTDFEVLSKENIEKLEDNFFKIDRQMTDRIQELYENNLNSSKKYKDSINIYETLKEKYINAENGYLKMKEFYKAENEKSNRLAADNQKINEKYNDLSRKYAEHLKMTYIANQEEINILNELKSIIKRLESQNNYLKSENAEYQRKIHIIKDTCVGKILIWGYHKLKKIKTKISK